MGFGSGEGFTPGRNNLVGDFTVEGNISASAALSGAYFFGDGSFLQNVTGSGGGGGGNVTVGDSIDSGTGNRVLYENSSNKIAESANLTFDGTTLAAATTTVTSLSASTGITGSSLWIGDTGTGITNTGVISATNSLTSSNGITGSSLQIGPAASGYGITNEGKFAISSFASNWTNAGITVADLGTVTTADINGGSIDGATIGANSAAAGTFGQVLADSFFVDQVAPDDLGDNTNTITAANMLKKISAVTLTGNTTKATDTAANIVAAVTNPVADMAFDWSIINSGEGPDMDLTLSAGAGVTLLIGFDDIVCRADDSVTLRVRLTNVGGGSEAVTIYRIA